MTGILEPAADRTVVVTGASSGIGAEMAKVLAGKGYGVTLVARREGPLRELASELSASVRAEVVTADLSDQKSRRAILPAIEERGLVAAALVNNAGFSTTGRIQDADPDRELTMLRTDVEAVVDLCTLFVPGMVARGGGAILNVASTAAFQPIPGQAGYAASKAFVYSYSRAIAVELKSSNITVTALCPGPVETEFIQAAGFDEERAKGSMPKFMWVPAPEVAKAGVDGMLKGKSVVIPGAPNRIAAYSAILTPKRVLLPILAKGHPAL
ncbi:MAG TPA: SDR family oxidoreductase [Mycobacteriales bacterium]|nr:SDR family oxidoreductase [Mycobacteriales bacterium]